jgi:hypothetical protein
VCAFDNNNEDINRNSIMSKFEFKTQIIIRIWRERRKIL